MLACPDLLTVRQIAQDYGMSAQILNKILEEEGVQYKPRGKGNPWHIHAKYGSHELAQTATHIFDGSDNTERTSLSLKWTQKGKSFICDLLKSKGILPISERQLNKKE